MPLNHPDYAGVRAAVKRDMHPALVQHPDTVAVNRFAEEMATKMAQARAKGRAGWETCPPDVLSRMLREHVEKGDPRDIANFCMMLWHLGQPIAAAPAAQAVEPAANEPAPIRVSLPIHWMKELVALCGPEQHELRDRVLKSLERVQTSAPADMAVPDLWQMPMPSNPHHPGSDPVRHIAWAKGAGAAMEAVETALAATPPAQAGEAIAEITSANHDAAEFGERGFRILRDFQHLDYGTKLYAHSAPQAQDVQRYRLLKCGEMIVATDDFLQDDSNWEKDESGIWVGAQWSDLLRPARRAIAASAAQGEA